MELGATDAEAGRKTGAEVGLGVLAACSRGDHWEGVEGASPLTGVQAEGGHAPTGPSMEKLQNSCLDSQPLGHSGFRLRGLAL